MRAPLVPLRDKYRMAAALARAGSYGAYLHIKSGFSEPYSEGLVCSGRPDGDDALGAERFVYALQARY